MSPKIIFLLIFLNLMLWNIFIPVFELPSEPLYFDRIQLIAQTNQLTDMRQSPPGDLVYPDTYPVLMVPVMAFLKPPPPTTIPWVKPQRGTYNRFVHSQKEQNFHWGKVEWAVHGIRFLTSLLTLLGLWFLYLTLQHLFNKNSYLPLTGLILVGFFPKFIHRSSSIVNLPLLFLAFTLFFYFAITQKPQPATAFKLGLAAGLALITKITGLNLLLSFNLYLLLFVPGWSKRFKHGLFFLTGFLLVSGWLLIRNTLLYADPLAMNQSMRIAADLAPAKVLPLFGNQFNYWFAIIETTFKTFWDGFGWENYIWGWPIHYALLFLTLICSWRFIRLLHNRQLVFLSLSLLIFIVSFLQVNTQFYTPQGKDFLPMILPISLIFLLGLPWKKISPTKLIAAAFVTNMLILFLQVNPMTLGHRNVSPAQYYQRLESDPIKRILRSLRHP